MQHKAVLAIKQNSYDTEISNIDQNYEASIFWYDHFIRIRICLHDY